MIVSFGDKATEDVFHGNSTKAALRLPKQLWSRIQRKLDSVNACTSVRDLESLPSNQLERLKGDWVGYWSIRVNDQYRIVFRFEEGNCHEVHCLDYH